MLTLKNPIGPALPMSFAQATKLYNKMIQHIIKFMARHIPIPKHLSITTKIYKNTTISNIRLVTQNQFVIAKNIIAIALIM